MSKDVQYMYTFIFEWDENKAAINRNKHKVSFEEAQSVFSDYFARIIPDPDHSQDEERFIIMGASKFDHVLIVCHCYRVSGNHIRIISARKATPRETNRYREFR